MALARLSEIRKMTLVQVVSPCSDWIFIGIRDGRRGLLPSLPQGAGNVDAGRDGGGSCRRNLRRRGTPRAGTQPLHLAKVLWRVVSQREWRREESWRPVHRDAACFISHRGDICSSFYSVCTFHGVWATAPRKCFFQNPQGDRRERKRKKGQRKNLH